MATILLQLNHFTGFWGDLEVVDFREIFGNLVIYTARHNFSNRETINTTIHATQLIICSLLLIMSTQPFDMYRRLGLPVIDLKKRKRTNTFFTFNVLKLAISFPRVQAGVGFNDCFSQHPGRINLS